MKLRKLFPFLNKKKETNTKEDVNIEDIQYRLQKSIYEDNLRQNEFYEIEKLNNKIEELKKNSQPYFYENIKREILVYVYNHGTMPNAIIINSLYFTDFKRHLESNYSFYNPDANGKHTFEGIALLPTSCVDYSTVKCVYID